MIDVFRVGVHIGMTTNGSQVIGMLLRELGLLHGSVDGIVKKMGQFRGLIIGSAAAFAGYKGLQVLWDMVKASGELNRELDRTRQLGGDYARTVGDARMAAIRTSISVPVSTPSENVRVQRELATQLQNPLAANAILPLAQTVAKVVSNYTGENSEDIVKNLVKVADTRAQIFSKGPDGQETVDAAKVMSEFSAAARGLILAGGYLKSNDLVQMARQAGVPAKSMTQEAFYANMVEMAVSAGAARTGTAVTSLFSQMIGGTMPVHVAHEMQRMGLLGAGEFKSDHGHITLAPEVSRRFSGIQTDPIAFITGPLKDLFDKRGLNDQQRLEEIFKLFGRQTTQRFVAEAFSADPQFKRARSMFGTIPDVQEQAKMLYDKDLDWNMNSFKDAWTGLMQVLGEAGIPIAISALHLLTGALHELTAFAADHPYIAQGLMAIAGALAALTAVSGTVAVASLLLGPLSSGIRGLIGSLAGAEAAGAGAQVLGTGLLGLIGTLSWASAALTGVTAGIAAAGAYFGFKGAQTSGEDIANHAEAGESPVMIDEFGNPIGYYRNNKIRDFYGPAHGEGVNTPYVPPTSNDGKTHVELRGDVHIDGNKVGSILAHGQTGADVGVTGPNFRIDPFPLGLSFTGP